MNSTLSREELQMERTGNFKALIASIPTSRGEASWRRLAARARAHAFLREQDEARTILEAIHANRSEVDDEAWTVCLLTEALLDRYAALWEEAQKKGHEALDIAKRNGWSELAADAQAGIAIAYAETGRLFLSADLYQEICSDPYVSPYRRSLAQSNWAWVLWDLGQTDAFKNSLCRIPEGSRAKHELLLSMHEGDFSLAHSWIRNGLPAAVGPDQTIQIAQALVEAYAVLGESESHAQLIRSSWLPDVLLSFTKSPNFIDRSASRAALKVLGLEAAQNEQSSVATSPSSWRSELDARFLEVLWVAKTSPSEVRDFYVSRINSALALRWWHRTPLMPRLETQGGSAYFVEDSPWVRALTRHLGVSTRHATGGEPVFELHQTEVVFQDGGVRRSLDLRKSPTSSRLLRVLATGNKRAFTKREIHQQLTVSTYSPRVHDARLFKLLKRIENRFVEAGIPSPWTLPGDNRVILSRPIEARS